MNAKKMGVFLKKYGSGIIIVASLTLFLIVGFILYFFRERETGPVGDAFNGLVGPFIALLSAILVYRSFVAQTEANQRQTEATLDQIKTNKVIQSQWMYETYLSMFNDVKSSYNNIKITTRPIEGIENDLYGEDAIKQYSDIGAILEKDRKKLEKDLESVLRITNYFFQKIQVVDIQERDIMLYLVIEYYQSYMQEALIKFRDKVISDKRDTELGETLILINFCNQHYIDLLKLFQSKI